MEIEREKADYHDVSSSLVVLFVVDCTACGPNNITDEHASARPDEECSTSESVDQKGSAYSCPKVEDLQEAVDECLIERIRDTDRIEDKGQVIADDTIGIYVSRNDC